MRIKLVLILFVILTTILLTIIERRMGMAAPYYMIDE